LAEHPQPNQLRQAARGKAVLDYNMTVMGNRYMALYEGVCKAAKTQVVKSAEISM
jgi:hypothetical protein